jgi:N-(2-amino-2-carboxyethyl)-L-glutamate synthase
MSIVPVIERTAPATATDAVGGILAAIGGTPLIELNRIYPQAPFRIFGKLEGANPGGSMKDRPALSMLLHAMSSERIVPGRGTLVESSSGNLAIGLAQACRYFRLRFVCVVDPKITAQNLAILRAYGAEIDMVNDADPATGEYLTARLRRVRELMERHRDWYWPNQYENPLNPAAHHRTMQEICEALDVPVDFVFCATSTTGTLRGCAEHVRASGLRTRLVGVDAEGSAIFGLRAHRRLVPGHGAAIRPRLAQDGLAHRVVTVSDLDCVVWCHRLVRREALLAGGSSGAVAAAVGRVDIPPGSTCVLVLPDRGERYLDTIYSPSWVEEHFGDISALLEESEPGGMTAW